MKNRDRNPKFGGADRDLDPLARQEQSRAKSQRIRELLQSSQTPVSPVHLKRPGVSAPTAMRYATTADPTSWMKADAGRPLIEAAFDAAKDGCDRSIMSWPSKPGGAFVTSCIFLREARASGRLAHATIGYWPWRDGATHAARSILVNPDDIADASLRAYNDPKKSEWQSTALPHDSLCMLEMRLKDLTKSSGSAAHASLKSIVVRSPTLLETTCVFAPSGAKGTAAFGAAPDQVLRRVRKYTSMGEKHAGLVDHVGAVGDPEKSPFALLGLPATSNPDGLTRYLTSARTKQLGLDIVVVDLTRTGRSNIQDEWEKRFEVLMTALDGFEGRRPAVLVVTEESFVQRRVFRLLKSHAGMRRPKQRAQQLGIYLDRPSHLGPAPEIPTEMAPISFQADIKDASLAPLRRDLVALGQSMREAGASIGADAVSRTLAFVRRCASLPLGLQEARQTADILYDGDDEVDASVRSMFRPKMAMAGLASFGDLFPAFAAQATAAAEVVEAKVAGWDAETPVAAKLTELLADPNLNSHTTTIALPDRRIAEVFIASDGGVHCRCEIVDHKTMAAQIAIGNPERIIVVGPTPEAVRALLTTRCAPKLVLLLGDAAGSALLSVELGTLESIAAFSSFAARAKSLIAALRRGGSDETLDLAEAEFRVAAVIKENEVDLTQSDDVYRGDVVHITMQSGLHIDYRPGGEVLLLSPGEARPFERIQARQAQIGYRILVLDASIREPIRLAIAGSRKSRQELAAYHGHVATIRLNTPGNSLAEKARNVLARMRAIDPSIGDEINNISRWLNADVARAPLEGARQPGAARDWPRFRVFMQAVGVDEVLAWLYWKAAVLPSRSYRAQEGHLFNQRVVQFVLDPESTGVWKTMQGLWQQVMESVDVIVDIAEITVGDDNG
jgi:hypothetical protein